MILKTKPIGVNSLYQGRRFLTKRGKQVKDSMAWEAKSQWKNKPLKGEIKLKILFAFKDNRMLDIDGGIKALLDCLTGICWLDDKQIVELFAAKKVDKDNPRIELTIKDE